MSSASDLEQLISDHLCEEHPDALAELSDQQLAARIGAGIKRARSHGLNTDGAVVAYVSLMFLVAPDFDEQPAIKKALAMPKANADERMKALFASTSEADWDDAAARSAGWGDEA